MSKRESDAREVLSRFVENPTTETWEAVSNHWHRANPGCPFNIMFESRCPLCPFNPPHRLTQLCPFYSYDETAISWRIKASIEAIALIEIYENSEVKREEKVL